MESMDRERIHANKLHDPSRRKEIREYDQHLSKARTLSRALWLLLGEWTEEFHEDNRDTRDLDAIYDISCELAHHTSAAEFALYTSESPVFPWNWSSAKRIAVLEFIEQFDAAAPFHVP